MSEERNRRNPPGLPSIAFGPGTHAEIYARLRQAIAARPPISALAQYAPTADPAMALVDCWAMVADVVGFYQERLANEAYLRTAVEDRSIVELTNEIGYEVNTGVAATTPLVFALSADDADDGIDIRTGTQVQSRPAEGEKPEIFETIEDIEARHAWNVLRPAPPAEVSSLLPVDWQQRSLVVAGSHAEIQSGDALLIRALPPAPGVSELPQWIAVLIETVAPDPSGASTVLRWSSLVGSSEPTALAGLETRPLCRLTLAHFRTRAQVFGYNAPDWKAMPKEIKCAYCKAAGECNASGETDETPCIDKSNWPGFALTGNDAVNLDRVVPAQLSDGWFLMVDQQTSSQSSPSTEPLANEPPPPWLSEVKSATIAAETKFTLTSQVTRIEGETPYGGNDALKAFDRRASVIYCNSAPLDLARRSEPYVVPVTGPSVILDQPAVGLPAGRKLVFSGKRPRIIAQRDGLELCLGQGKSVAIPRGASLRLLNRPFELPSTTNATESCEWSVIADDGVAGTVTAEPLAFAFAAARDADPDVVELAVLEAAPSAQAPRLLELTDPLDHWLDPVTLQILANVADATHGATVTDQLGGASPPEPSLQLRLNYQPLTYVTARRPSGRRSTLELRVDGILWTEVDTLYGQSPDAAVYVIETDASGDSFVRFGDGRRGRRPPAGLDNVVAVYRTGIGPGGNVGPDRITILLDAVPRIQSATNPLPAQGASPLPGVHKSARVAATHTRALGRIVSLKDYGDFAAGFAGIAKASAVLRTTPAGVTVVLTIAAQDGRPVTKASRQFRYLADAIARYGDPGHAVEIVNYERVERGLDATIWIDRGRDFRAVHAAVKARLIERYGFVARRLGQRIAPSELLADIMSIAGVELAEVTLTELRARGGQRVRVDGAEPSPARLELLDPDAIAIMEKTW